MLCRERRTTSVRGRENKVRDSTRSAHTCIEKIDGAFVVSALVSLESEDVKSRRVAPEVVDVWYTLNGHRITKECWRPLLQEPGW